MDIYVELLYFKDLADIESFGCKRSASNARGVSRFNSKVHQRDIYPYYSPGQINILPWQINRCMLICTGRLLICPGRLLFCPGRLI